MVAKSAPDTSNESRRERRGRELRERIVIEAQRLFLDRGFENTTVNQIAEAADIVPATFFNHFQSKAGLLNAVTAEVLEYLQGILEEEFAQDATTREKIISFANRVAVEILDVRELAHDALLGLIRAGAQDGQVALHASQIRAPFASMLRQGQENGEVRDDYDAIFLAELVIGALNAAITNWLSDYEYPLADRLHETATFMAEAIGRCRG